MDGGVTSQGHLVATVPDLHARQALAGGVPQRHNNGVHTVVHYVAQPIQGGHLQPRKHCCCSAILCCIADPPVHNTPGLSALALSQSSAAPTHATYMGHAEAARIACGLGEDSPLQGAIIGRIDDPLISGNIQNSLCLQGGHIAAMMQLCHSKAACTPEYPLSTSLLPEQRAAAAFTQARQHGKSHDQGRRLGARLGAGTCLCPQSTASGAFLFPDSGCFHPTGCIALPS